MFMLHCVRVVVCLQREGVSVFCPNFMRLSGLRSEYHAPLWMNSKAMGCCFQIMRATESTRAVEAASAMFPLQFF